MPPFGRQSTGTSGIFFCFCGFKANLVTAGCKLKDFIFAKFGNSSRVSSFLILDFYLLLFSIIRNNIVLCKIEDYRKGKNETREHTSQNRGLF